MAKPRPVLQIIEDGNPVGNADGIFRDRRQPASRNGRDKDERAKAAAVHPYFPAKTLKRGSSVRR
jgi:hypothetical protein